MSELSKLVFRLCAAVVRAAYRLIRQCSKQCSDNIDTQSADLHPASFLMQLLVAALKSLRWACYT
jgi:hypothetical protein